jgi:hypothetical protein
MVVSNVHMALYRRRLLWRVRRRPPRPAGGEAASRRPLRPSARACGMSQAFATSSPQLRSARALLYPAEDIGSALKGRVNVCQRQPVNEVFGPLVTKSVRNFGREGATPIQRGPNASLFGRVQSVKLIRHNALQHLRAVALPVGRLLSAPGSKWCRQTPPPALLLKVASGAIPVDQCVSAPTRFPIHRKPPMTIYLHIRSL